MNFNLFKMFLIKQFLLLLFISSSGTDTLNNLPTQAAKTKRTQPPIVLNSNTNVSYQKIFHTNSSITQINNYKTSTIFSEDAPVITDTTADEIKNEVFVNDLLETVEESNNITEPESYRGPYYELNWDFTDKETIRVTFDLFSVPTSLIENSRNSEKNKLKLNLLATMSIMPSRSLKSINLLKYFHFIIRPYNKNREIILKMAKLNIKNMTSSKDNYFSNALRLTALNHHEKYSVCICYYQTNSPTKIPDLLLCQDIINDYAKFGHLRADAKHSLVFIFTQYSIIIALLVVLQSVFTMRKRRVAQIIGQLVTNKAHSIRTTFSSVSLVRQSFSSLDAAAEQQQQQQQQQQHQHATNGHAIQREPTIDEEGRLKKRIISSPAIVISEPSTTMSHGATSSDETEPFLKRIPSKNHVHFLLGPGEGSDEDGENEDINTNTALNHQMTSLHREPYDDQGDALLSMAHILDTNKPWSRHIEHTSPV